VQQRRTQWLKEHGPCVQCGSTKRLEVDHIDPKEKVDHKVWSWSKERREAELAKCQVLCGTCHDKKTLEQRPKTEHGRLWMYQKYRCRCELCRAAKRADDKARRGARRSVESNLA
jgi:hypothetical protein